MLNAQKSTLIRKNIVPVFLYGNTIIETEIPYDTIKVDVEEKYTNLYKKLYLGYKHIYELYNFEHIIKIDDDTFLNVDLINNIAADYTGRFIKTYSNNSITIDLPMYNLHKKILIYPDFFKDSFKFATGDCYILSKRAIEYIINSNIYNNIKSADYICEDQLFGYILSHHSDIICNDITFENNTTIQHTLQVTKDCMSIHPIHEAYMDIMINTPLDQQLHTIASSKLSSVSRNMQLQILENSLRQVINDFANTLKPTGLG